MDSLLCDEAWLSSPGVTPIDHHHARHHSSESYLGGSFYMTKEDSEEALAIYLEKEISYMPEANYVEHLRSENFTSARYRATQWLFRVSFSILENHFSRVQILHYQNGKKKKRKKEKQYHVKLTRTFFNICSPFFPTRFLCLVNVCFLQSRSRLNLSFGTAFNAVNYLDRFISMNQCNVSNPEYL
jgi:hypothetical protein